MIITNDSLKRKRLSELAGTWMVTDEEMNRINRTVKSGWLRWSKLKLKKQISERFSEKI